MSFLPENYKIPENSNYLVLEKGENRFRVLSSAIVGFEYWTSEGKPVRLRKMPSTVPPDIRIGEDGRPEPIKNFWAFVVWNYNKKSIQIMEVTQKTIQRNILTLARSKKWGDPKNYDVTIIREGTGYDTKYTVLPNPPSELDSRVIDLYKRSNINPEALYVGVNPFEDSPPLFVEEEKEEEQIQDTESKKINAGELSEQLLEVEEDDKSIEIIDELFS